MVLGRVHKGNSLALLVLASSVLATAGWASEGLVGLAVEPRRGADAATPAALAEAGADVGAPASQATAGPHGHLQAAAAEALGGLAFEPNVGQGPPEALFVGHGAQHVLVTPTTVWVHEGGWVGVRLADKPARIVPLEPQAAVSHTFLGNDPAGWVTGIPRHGALRMQGVAEGVDVLLHSEGGRLRFDHVVAPGANAAAVTFALEGHDEAWLEGGRIALRAGGATLHLREPYLYQDLPHGRVQVQGRYVLEGAQVRYDVGAHDATHPLVIDPVLRHSTYLGTSSTDVILGVAVRNASPTVAEVAVAGYTLGTGAPAAFASSYAHTGSFPGSTGMAGSLAFVAKLQYDAVTRTTSPLWYARLGGNLQDQANAVAMDAGGDVYITGFAYSNNFPIANAIVSPTDNGGVFDGSIKADPAGCNWPDPFVARIAANGASIPFSSFLGGGGNDRAFGVAVDGEGHVAITGEAQYNYLCGSPQPFPLRNADQVLHADTGNTGLLTDAFVAKVDMDATPPTLVFSTYHGGAGADAGRGVRMDAAGNVIVAGLAGNGAAFPTTSGAYRTSGAGTEGFVTKYGPGGARLFTTLLGGSSSDEALGLDLEPGGAVWVAGRTSSTDFGVCGASASAPCSGTPVQSSLQGGNDGFVVRLLAAGSGVGYATYLGGSNGDEATGVAWDAAFAQVVVSGSAQSTGLPAGQQPGQAKNSGTTVYDAFVARIDPASTAPLRHLAYLGASTAAFGRGVAVDGRSVTYLAGDTAAFTPTAGAVQPTAGGGLDGFLAIYGKRPPAAAFEAKPQGGTTHAVPPAAEASFLSLTSVALSSKAQAGDVAIASTAWRLARYGSDVWSGTGETATIPASILTPGTYELCHDAVDADVRTPPTDHLGTECLQLAVQNRPPSADILLPSTVVLGTPATFQSQATDLDGSIVVQQWQFGDGGTASGPSATYTFATPGATTVLLVVKDDLGATASVTKTVNVLRPPQASFEHTHPAYSGFVVTFQDTSSAGSLPIESWVWQFPGEAPVYGRGPHHRILPVGEHVVQLTVKTAVAQSVATAHVEVRQADPTPVPDEHSGFQGLAIEVAAPGPLGNDENPYNLELTMDVTRLPRHGTLLWHADGSFTYQPEPGFVGDDAFEYTIPRATKGATVALRVLAFPPPVAAFTAEAYDLEVRFRDESRTSHHPIVLWEWEFGDGWRGNGPSPTHTYREPGIHLVWLTVTDASGASNRTWRHVLVEDIPGIVPEALTGRSPAGGAGAAAAQQGGPAVLGALAAGGLRAAPAPAQPEAATPPPPQQAAPAGLPAWLAARPDAAPAPAAAGGAEEAQPQPTPHEAARHARAAHAGAASPWAWLLLPLAGLLAASAWLLRARLMLRIRPRRAASAQPETADAGP